MRLIDADVLKMCYTGSNGYDDKAEYFSIRKMINLQPTAFDLESVIAELEKKRDLCYAEMEKERNKMDYFSGHIFDEYHNKGMAYNDCLKILKSAVNATNGKIGG